MLVSKKRWPTINASAEAMRISAPIRDEVVYPLELIDGHNKLL